MTVRAERGVAAYVVVVLVLTVAALAAAAEVQGAPAPSGPLLIPFAQAAYYLLGGFSLLVAAGLFVVKSVVKDLISAHSRDAEVHANLALTKALADRMDRLSGGIEKLGRALARMEGRLEAEEGE